MARTSFGISNLPLPLSPMSQLPVRRCKTILGLMIWTCAIEAIASTSDPIVTDLDHLANYNFADRRRVPSEGSRVKVIRQMRGAPAAGRGPRDCGVLLTTF